MRGNAAQVKVHYKGSDDDYIVFVDSAQAVRDWKADKSIPLAQVVSGWKVFVTHKYVFIIMTATPPDPANKHTSHGTQGVLDAASHSQLDNEFGTHKEEDVVQQILEKGDIQETENSARNGDRNITQGPSVGH
ncbi:hypothetical protein E4T39_05304 [Aureobasidium subglaciale]|nr:hypothetical protein E4T39_05304 [Aureobasidium subglaciale]